MSAWVCASEVPVEWLKTPLFQSFLAELPGGPAAALAHGLAQPGAEDTQNEAALRVLADLAAQGWGLEQRAGSLWVKVPEKSVDPVEEKVRVRAQHHVERARQLQKASVQSFLREMETNRLRQGEFRSIYSLMREGPELVEALRRDPTGAIRPYLQVIRGEEKCKKTSLRLMDIWRYFRHTWATPHNPTPGRGMMILVRDAAVEPNPVIGIAQLSSPAAQIAVRDAWIGWGPTEVVAEIRTEPTARRAAWLLQTFQKVLEEIYIQDFLEDGLLLPEDLQEVRPGVVERLVEDAKSRRFQHVRVAEAGSVRRLDVEEDEEELEEGEATAPGSWEGQARSPLFRAKRAELLAKLLDMQPHIRLHLPNGPDVEGLKRLAETTAGARAIRTLARRAKAERMGTAVAEVSVCGAISPYRELIGGKLVAMLMCSPELREAYRERYGTTPSLIASSMAGRPIQRGAELALLMTTSLYGSGSSQYNRIRIPREVFGGKGEPLGYLDIGATVGFGSSQFGEETIKALATLSSQSEGGRKINSLFGEGVNPRLRKARDGLDRLGLDSDLLLRHGNPRVIYAVPLADNFRAFLQGLESDVRPNVPMEGAAGTAAIATWWTQRWLLKRAENARVLEEVAAHRARCLPPRHGARVEREEVAVVDRQVGLFGA